MKMEKSHGGDGKNRVNMLVILRTVQKLESLLITREIGSEFRFHRDFCPHTSWDQLELNWRQLNRSHGNSYHDGRVLQISLEVVCTNSPRVTDPREQASETFNWDCLLVYMYIFEQSEKGKWKNGLYHILRLENWNNFQGYRGSW